MDVLRRCVEGVGSPDLASRYGLASRGLHRRGQETRFGHEGREFSVELGVEELWKGLIKVDQRLSGRGWRTHPQSVQRKTRPEGVEGMD